MPFSCQVDGFGRTTWRNLKRRAFAPRSPRGAISDTEPIGCRIAGSLFRRTQTPLVSAFRAGACRRRTLQVTRRSRPDLIFLQTGATLRRQLDEWLAAGGVRTRPAMEISHTEAIKQTVAAGLGASLVPLCSVTGGYALPGLVVRPLRPALSWSLGLIQRRDKPNEPALHCVREALLTLADG